MGIFEVLYILGRCPKLRCYRLSALFFEIRLKKISQKAIIKNFRFKPERLTQHNLGQSPKVEKLQNNLSLKS